MIERLWTLNFSLMAFVVGVILTMTWHEWIMGQALTVSPSHVPCGGELTFNDAGFVCDWSE